MTYQVQVIKVGILDDVFGPSLTFLTYNILVHTPFIEFLPLNKDYLLRRKYIL